MRRWCTVGIAILLLAMVAFGAPSPVLPLSQKSKVMNIDADLTIPMNTPGFVPRHGELDEIVGDTVFVGMTYWDNQHNGTVGRMIGFTPEEVIIGGDPVTNVSFVVWTRLTQAQPAGSRHTHFNRAWFDANGNGHIEAANGNVVDASNRAGYTTIGMDAERGLAVPSYHARSGANDDFHPELAWEWSIFPGIFTTYNVPDFGENINIWPHVQCSEYQGERVLHMVTSESRTNNVAEMDILYSRHVYNEFGDTWEVGDQILITEHGMNISADIGVSYDGRRVAIGQTVSRDILYHPGGDTSQHNNDLWLFISEDGGNTWNLDDPIDLTHFIMPEIPPGPDTLASEGDTVRAYTDCNVYFDHDDILHVAFTVECYFYHAGTITYTSQIYHWDEESDVMTMAADGRFWNHALPEVWGRSCDRPSMYQDPDTGILWMIYRQLGVPGDTLDDGWSRDGSDDRYGHYEIFVTASPPNNEYGDWYGRMWAKGINVTNTRGTTGNLVAGEGRRSRSQRCPQQ